MRELDGKVKNRELARSTQAKTVYAAKAITRKERTNIITLPIDKKMVGTTGIEPVTPTMST